MFAKRFLLSTVLVVFSTDTKMLFSVAGFQTSTVKKKGEKIYISIIDIDIHMLDMELGVF